MVAASVVHGMYQRKESKKPKPLVIQATIHIHCVRSVEVAVRIARAYLR